MSKNVPVKQNRPSNAEKQELARKLRVDEKKSFREIQSLIKVPASTLCRWAKKEGWPDPQKESRELKRIVELKNKKQEYKNENNVKLPSDMPVVDFDQPIDKMVKDLFVWCCRASYHSARFNTRTQLKLADLALKVMIGLKEDSEQRHLTVFIPETSESYRKPPCSD
jgi:hypothetical protein